MGMVCAPTNNTAAGHPALQSRLPHSAKFRLSSPGAALLHSHRLSRPASARAKIAAPLGAGHRWYGAPTTPTPHQTKLGQKATPVRQPAESASAAHSDSASAQTPCQRPGQHQLPLTQPVEMSPEFDGYSIRSLPLLPEPRREMVPGKI